MSVQSLDLLRILSSIKMHKQRGEKRHFGTLKEAEDGILSLLVVVAIIKRMGWCFKFSR